VGLALTALLPQPLKQAIYRWCFRYRIGRNVRIGVSFLDCERLEIEDNARIGHLNVFWGCGPVRLGKSALVGFGNILRGGSQIDLDSYSVVGRLNGINAIPEPDASNPTDPRFLLGHGAIIVSEHRIDFTDRVTIGRRSIIAGRNSSFWTHNRQSTRPISIGDFCYIGSEIRLTPGSALPNRTILGIGAVVTKPFTEEGNLVAGVPAKVVRALNDEDMALLNYKTRPDLPDLPGVDCPALAGDTCL